MICQHFYAIFNLNQVYSIPVVSSLCMATLQVVYSPKLSMGCVLIDKDIENTFLYPNFNYGYFYCIKCTYSGFPPSSNAWAHRNHPLLEELYHRMHINNALISSPRIHVDQHYVKRRSSVRISKPKMQYIDRPVFDMKQIQMYVMGRIQFR